MVVRNGGGNNQRPEEHDHHHNDDDDNGYMIMIHKLYVDRLQSYLIDRCSSFSSSSGSSSSSSSSSSTRQLPTVTSTSTVSPALLQDDDHSTEDHTNHQYLSFQMVHTPKITGVSQARRGYVLLYITAAPPPPHQLLLPPLMKHPNDDDDDDDDELSSRITFLESVPHYLYDVSPMMRQNISWICPIQHYYMCKSSSPCGWMTNSSNHTANSECIGHKIWSTIFINDNNSKSDATSNDNNNLNIVLLQDLSKVLLRVDCYPKQYLEPICQQLQCSCATHRNDNDGDNNTNKININATTAAIAATDPFDGPIAMTMSKSKCTHKLSIVIIQKSTSTSITTNQNNNTTTAADSDGLDVYWGIECRPAHNNNTTTKDDDTSKKNTPNSSSRNVVVMDLPLNHDAADEIIVVPGIDQYHPLDTRQSHATTITDHITKSPNVFDTTIVPLSRAYYKLYDIWYTYLYPQAIMQQSLFRGTAIISAIDLGAAPGGWTQVLLNHMNVTNVLAIDRAQLADRSRFIVTSDSDTNQHHKQHIFHVPSTLENLNLRDYYHNYERPPQPTTTIPTLDVPSPTTDIESNVGPPTLFSYFVCDASVQWNVLLPMILQQLQRPDNRTVIQWTIPSVVILTLKLPFKTIHSIRRHLLDIQKQVPPFIQQLTTIMYGTTADNHHHNTHHQLTTTTTTTQPSSRYRIIHCMANSDSERTLLIEFFSVSNKKMSDNCNE